MLKRLEKRVGRAELITILPYNNLPLHDRHVQPEKVLRLLRPPRRGEEPAVTDKKRQLGRVYLLG